MTPLDLLDNTLAVIQFLLVLALITISWAIFWPRGWAAYDRRHGQDIDASADHRARHPKTGRPRD